jgi:hypothetical protein
MAHLENVCGEPAAKIRCLQITVAVALICGFGLSWRLWISSRMFPASPVSDFLPVISFPVDQILFASMLGLLLVIIVFARPQRLILTFLVLAGFLSLLDQTRWQPWFYQYFFMMAALGLDAWKKPEGRNQAALNACRVIVIFTYVWSGLQKLNVNFVRETWTDLAGPFLRAFPEVVKSPPPFLILIIPLVEISIGLGLITRKYRNVAVILVIATHAFVLILLISGRANIVVWPWNIAMALFAVILFWQDKDTCPRRILVPKNAFHALVLILFGVLPAFSLIGLWDSYLSSALYSGNTDQAVIYVSRSVTDRLPEKIQTHVWPSNSIEREPERFNAEAFFLDIKAWAYDELNVPGYPEPRVYKRVAEHICTLVKNSGGIKLRIREKPNPITGLRGSQYYDCKQLNSLQ